MSTDICYCPACQHEVRILEPTPHAWDGHAPVANFAGPICLDPGKACPETCALTGLPRVVMLMRLRSHQYPRSIRG